MKNGFLVIVSRIAPYWRSIGVGLLLALVFALFGYHFLQDPVSFNSDQLYCIHFCDELVQGHSVQGFHVPAAPYVFPDMALVVVCRLLASNLAVAFLLYAFLYYGLLLLVLMALCQGMGLLWAESFQIAGLGVSLLLAFYFDPAYYNFGVLLSYPGNHMGCMLIGLAITAYTLRALQSGYRPLSTAVLAGVCALSGFSDQLLIVQYLIPLCAAVLLLSVFRQVGLRRGLFTIALLGVSSLVALKLRRVALWLGLVPMRVESAESLLGMQNLDAFWDFCANVPGLIREQQLTRFVLCFHVLAAIAALVVWWRRRDGSAGLDRPSVLVVALVLLLAPLVNADILIVTRTVEPFAVTRYLYTWWYLPLLFLVLWARLLPGRVMRLVPVLVLLLVAFRIGTFPDRLSWDRLAPRYPRLAQALDEMVRKHGPLRGFSEYWRAREMHYLTHERVAVVPILNNGSPWFHGFNPNSFLADDRHDTTIPEYHFVVFPAAKDQAGPDPDMITARYGKPVEIIPAGDHVIWRYEHMHARSLDLFLRAQVAQRLVREKPYLAPAEPPALRQPKRNLTPCEARGNVPLQRGQELTIHFDQPARGAMIDVSANYCDAYALVFLRDGRELARTRVPAIDWTGAESIYCRAGLQSRLVQVPLACRSEGFTEAKLIPEGRSTQFAVGHFLVFDEWIPYRSEESRPRERYHRYEGEQLHCMNSPEITMRQEPSASAGHSRQATAAYQGCLAYGPYTILAPGRYRLDFALKVADNHSAEVVATIDSCAFRGEQILESRTLHGVDFTAADQYQTFSLTFEAKDELDFVEYRVLVSGKTEVTLDYIDVTRLSPDHTSEACER